MTNFNRYTQIIDIIEDLPSFIYISHPTILKKKSGLNSKIIDLTREDECKFKKIQDLYRLVVHEYEDIDKVSV